MNRTEKQALAMEHLDRANNVRVARAAVKRRVKTGETTLADALAAQCCRGMRLMDLLEAQRQWGPARTWRLVKDLQRRGFPAWPSMPVRDLGDSGREALVELSGRRAA